MSGSISVKTLSISDLTDCYLENFEGSTLFFSKSFLGCLDVNLHIAELCVGNSVVALSVVIADISGRNIIYQDPCVYSGLLFSRDYFATINRARMDSQRYKLTVWYASFLAENYESVEIQFSPEITDLRAFQWWNWGGKNVYKIGIRYTSFISLSDTSSTSGWSVKHMDEQRRRLYRKFQNGSCQVVTDVSVDFLLRCLKRNLEDQHVIEDYPLLDNLERVVAMLVQDKKGMTFTFCEADGSPSYSAFYGWLNQRAYYLFGGGSKNGGSPERVVATHVCAFEFFKENEIAEIIDLEGVNSPNRGATKLGFGGGVCPYYTISLEQRDKG